MGLKSQSQATCKVLKADMAVRPAQLGPDKGILRLKSCRTSLGFGFSGYQVTSWRYVEISWLACELQELIPSKIQDFGSRNETNIGPSSAWMGSILRPKSGELVGD